MTAVRMKKKYSQRLLFALIVLQTAFIFANSDASVEESVSVSGGVTAFLKSFLDPTERIDDELFHHLVRKTAHFTEFFLLSALYTLFYRLSAHKRELTLLAPLGGLATAVADEFIQSFTGRGSSVRDVVLDFAGVLTAYAITTLVLHGLRKNGGDRLKCSRTQ